MIHDEIFVRSWELFLDFLADFVLKAYVTVCSTALSSNLSLSFSGKLLNALLSGLSDRSPSVRRSYATAIGHLVKVTNHVRCQSKD